MRDDNFTDVRPRPNHENKPLDQDEVDIVLTVLRELSKKVTSPVIKLCLELTRADIAHLASPNGTLQDEDADDWEDDAFDDTSSESDAG